jgi:hypothetical protein
MPPVADAASAITPTLIADVQNPVTPIARKSAVVTLPLTHPYSDQSYGITRVLGLIPSYFVRYAPQRVSGDDVSLGTLRARLSARRDGGQAEHSGGQDPDTGDPRKNVS